jgi:hypothetical protein
VLFKPSHGLRILRNQPGGGFSPKAEYIFRKQLEEADAIVINRIDELTPAETDELAGLVAQQYPGTPVLKTSGRTGQGLESLVELLDQDGHFGRKILDIDYDTYAEGEAEMGWLNSTVAVTAPQPFALDELLVELVDGLQGSLSRLGGEVAHLKIIGLGDGSFGVANLVSTAGKTELSLPARSDVRKVEVIVNARVAIDPAELEKEVRRVVASASGARKARADFQTTQSLRPGRPVPTHRYARAV